MQWLRNIIYRPMIQNYETWIWEPKVEHQKRSPFSFNFVPTKHNVNSMHSICQFWPTDAWEIYIQTTPCRALTSKAIGTVTRPSAPSSQGPILGPHLTSFFPQKEVHVRPLLIQYNIPSKRYKIISSKKIQKKNETTLITIKRKTKIAGISMIRVRFTLSYW